jgi:hypothetical protein
LGTLEAGFESADDIFKTFTDLIGNPSDSGEDSLLGSLNSAYNEYKNIVSSVMEDAGTPLNEYSNLISTALWGEGGTETNPTGGLVDNVKTAAD